MRIEHALTRGGQLPFLKKLFQILRRVFRSAGSDPLPNQGQSDGKPVASGSAATSWNLDGFNWLRAGRARISGWAFGSAPVREIEVTLGGRKVAVLPSGLRREDVATAFAGAPGALLSGFEGEFELGSVERDIDLVEVVAKCDRAERTTLMRRSVFAPAFRQRWSPALDQRGVVENDVFYFPIATSLVAQGGAGGIRETFGEYESRTVKAGIRVQILYLRTTLGSVADYEFDPDFVADKRVGERLIAEDNLNDVIRFAIAERMPVLFTLNGGIWADSACESVEWDVNDALELDESLCQWNEKNQVMPDDALANQPGSFESPELGRSLSLNVYMDRMRFYKKRNLQHAARIIRRFADEHPALFIGVNLDPDVYVNPFFEGSQWYDYNPATLRQFRHWLRGDGPYVGDGGEGVPDLSRYRRPAALSLADVDALTGRRHASWDEVDAPREFPTKVRQFWKDPWVGQWEQFRRHLVQLHYDELALWVAEAGISTGRIYSSQGFMPPGELIDPLPVRLDSPAKNYDTGGMSIEGSAPPDGHLGAILYGKSAVNDVRMEADASLFAEFRHYSPEWAVVEFNTADLTTPKRRAGIREGYRALRDVANYGGRFVSPMAWNGSPGEKVGADGFLGYTSLRRSPLEEAIQHFMLLRADLPRRARLWAFGAGDHADDDGWLVNGQPAKPVAAGELQLRVGGTGLVELQSPPELGWTLAHYSALVVRMPSSDQPLSLQVQAQDEGGGWLTLVPETPWNRFEATPAGTWVPLDWPSQTEVENGPRFQRLQLTWRGVNGTAFTLRAVALYPR